MFVMPPFPFPPLCEGTGFRIDESDYHLAWYRVVHQTFGVRIIRSYLDVIDTLVFKVDLLMRFLNSKALREEPLRLITFPLL